MDCVRVAPSHCIMARKSPARSLYPRAKVERSRSILQPPLSASLRSYRRWLRWAGRCPTGLRTTPAHSSAALRATTRFWTLWPPVQDSWRQRSYVARLRLRTVVRLQSRLQDIVSRALGRSANV